jgi:hypothetical protein
MMKHIRRLSHGYSAYSETKNSAAERGSERFEIT